MYDFGVERSLLEPTWTFHGRCDLNRNAFLRLLDAETASSEAILLVYSLGVVGGNDDDD